MGLTNEDVLDGDGNGAQHNAAGDNGAGDGDGDCDGNGAHHNGADDNGDSQNSHRVCIMGLRCKFASTANWFKSKIVSFETKSFLQIQNTQTICMRNKNIANVRTREEGGVEADTRQ